MGSRQSRLQDCAGSGRLGSVPGQGDGLAAAGTPVGLAYVGSRTPSEFASNDLIVPIPMIGRGEEGLLSERRRHRDFPGQAMGRTGRLLDQGALLDKRSLQAGGPRSRKAADNLGRGIGRRQQIKEKTGIAGFGVVAKTFDNTMHQFCIGFTPTTAPSSTRMATSRWTARRIWRR